HIDADAVTCLRDATWAAMPGTDISFHRAMDVAIAAGHADASIDILTSLGITRVLTSGGAERSLDGAPTLAKLVTRAAGRLQIMAGGGVRPQDVAALAATGVDAVHLSASAIVAWPGASSGPGGGDSDGIQVTDEDKARAVAQAVTAVNAQRS
ncbi:MAG: hypothetical protein FWD80_07150, partial [Propionibacteriaceae bacterium]|nr:hypothetical protein [Propionibacteriaceae bacterium]